MWVISKYGFVSVVEHRDMPGSVVVRARDRSDLEEFCSVARDCDVPGFSEVVIEENSGADYRFRMTVKSEDWAELAKVLALGIDYPNFKNEVASVDRERAAIYGTVWSDLMKIQFPDSGTWPDARDQDRRDGVERLYREVVALLEGCLSDYEGSLPAAEESEMLGSAMDPPVIVEDSDPDAVAILEERLIQRIAIGFWWQAGGRGLERLRNAIDHARAAAELRLTDSDWADVD